MWFKVPVLYDARVSIKEEKTTLEGKEKTLQFFGILVKFGEAINRLIFVNTIKNERGCHATGDT